MDREIHYLRWKFHPKGAQEVKKYKQLIEAFDSEIFQEAREAVLRKYLIWCKTDYID